MIRDDVSDVSEVASGWRCLSVCRLGRLGMALLFGSERAPGDDEGYAGGGGSVCRYVCLDAKFGGFLTMGRVFFEIPG